MNLPLFMLLVLAVNSCYGGNVWLRASNMAVSAAPQAGAFQV